MDCFTSHMATIFLRSQWYYLLCCTRVLALEAVIPEKKKIKLVIHCSNSLPDSIRFLVNLLDKHECSFSCPKKSLEFTESLVPSRAGYNSHFWTQEVENIKFFQFIFNLEQINICKIAFTLNDVFVLWMKRIGKTHWDGLYTDQFGKGKTK